MPGQYERRRARRFKQAPKHLWPKRRLCDRFWEKVDVREPDECWEWQGVTNGAYGYLYLGQKKVGAHRVSLMLTRRDPGPLRHALHKCGNKLCVNPHHLYPGSREENCADAKRDGVAPRGERHGRSKLTVPEVRAIRLLNDLPDWSQSRIAEAFGISQTAVSKIVLRKKWAHVA